jgi:serine/threonine protein kinase
MNNAVLSKPLTIPFSKPLIKNNQNGHEDDDDEEEDLDDNNDRVIEESPNGRWSKLSSVISEQKIGDFDSIYLALDTDKGVECAWNEMCFHIDPNDQKFKKNRFDSIDSFYYIFNKLTDVLDYLINLDHVNILRFYDYFLVETDQSVKLVVITEITGSSLKKSLESAQKNKTRVKSTIYKRWLNQIVYSIKYLHSRKISLFEGNIYPEQIFIQNNGGIKLAPPLFFLTGACEMSHKNQIKVIQQQQATSLGSSPLILGENGPGSSLSKFSIIKLLTKDKIIKDFNSIGRLAISIFEAHSGLSTNLSSPHSPKMLNYNELDIFELLKTIDDTNRMKLINSNQNGEDELQTDFVERCLNAERYFDSETGQFKIEYIWCHPLINTIYSLRVLSVFSVLNYFQYKSSIKYKRSIKAATPQPQRHHLRSGSIQKEINKSISLCSLNNTTNNTDTLSMQNDSKDSSTLTVPLANNSYSFNSCNTEFNATFNSYSHILAKRKVSLTFLSDDSDFKLPRDFFSILEDIRSGLYPRLLKEDNEETIQSIEKESYMDFLIKHHMTNCSFNNNNNKQVKNASPSKDAPIKIIQLDDNKIEKRSLIIENCRCSVTKTVNPLKQQVHSNNNSPEVMQQQQQQHQQGEDDDFENLKLSLQLQFSDKFVRYVECSLESLNETKSPLNNLAIELTNELVSFYLINENDFNCIFKLILNTLNENIINK